MAEVKVSARSSLSYPDSDTERPYREVTRTSLAAGTKHGLDAVIINQPASSVYGEQHSVSLQSFIEASPRYGLIPANFRSYTSGGGGANISGSLNNEFRCQSGTTLGAYGAIQSFRSVNANPGRGVGINFSARYPSSTSTTWQGVGLVSVGDEISFGYSGTSFGVWHRYGGAAEVRTLTVSGAAGGAENCTVTINSTAYVIAITASTTAVNAKEIANYLNTNATGYAAFQNGSTVVVQAQSDGPKSDTWSFSSATATASFARTTTGVTKTSDFTAQTSWNGDVFDGFDPIKGNTYQIKIQGGYGDIYFYIFDPETNRFTEVHKINFLNNQTQPNVRNLSMRVGMYSTAIGVTTNVDVYCAHFNAFVENGGGLQTRNPRSQLNTKSVDTNSTNVLSVRNRAVYNGITNQAEIVLLNLSIATESTKNTIIEIRGNPTVAGSPNWTDAGTNLISEYDTSGTTVSGGGLLASFSLANVSNAEINLKDIGIRLPPTLTIVVAARVTSGAASSVTATLTWVEEI